MDAAVAETVVRATREQAANDAQADLKEMRRRAVEAGRERSRKITKTSRIDPRTGEIRYNPAGRLLRDWYVHVYLNTLRANLSQPSVPIDAQQVEDMTTLLRKLRPGASRDNTLHAVGLIRNVAVDDAARAAAEIVTSLKAVGERRAIRHAPDDRFDADPLRVHVARHWYVRCYQDHVERTTLSQQPLTGVTRGEEVQVARVLVTRVPSRLVGDDGVPLITAHGTYLTEVDRRLATGDTHIVEPISDPNHHTDAEEHLRSRITKTWAELDLVRRGQWLRIAGVPEVAANSSWSRLTGEAQSMIIDLYLRTHTPAQFGLPFQPAAIDNEPSEAARLIFGHRAALEQSHTSEASLDLSGAGGGHFSEVELRISGHAALPTIGP